MRFTLSLAAAALILCGEAGLADRLVTNDGRVLELDRARKLPDGGYQLSFPHGEIICPEEFVASVEIEGDMSDYIPKSDDERKKLEMGFVRYRDRWMSKGAYQIELNRAAEERRQRTEELAAHADFRDGWEAETKHFRFKTNTSPELLEYYGELLEAFYRLMDDRIGIKPTPSLKRTKMMVNVYKSRQDFHRNNPGMHPGVAGFFNRVLHTLNFYHDYQEPSSSEWVSLHECTHLLTYLIDQDYLAQIWINEAVADYFGSSTITRDKKGKLEIEPGAPQLDRILTVQQAIKDGNDIPLEDLFLIERDDFHAFEYAHAWSFVYFLNETEDYRKGFTRFFKELYTLKVKGAKAETVNVGSFNKSGVGKIYSPEDIRDHLLKKIKVKDVAQLDKDWKDFVANIDLNGPHARFKRAYRVVMTMNTDEYETALEDLDAAIEAGVDDPRAYSARGIVKIVHKQKFDEAEEDFIQAIELAPLNSYFRYLLAQTLSGRFSMSGAEGGGNESGEDDLIGSDEELEGALTQFGLATDLAPENDLIRRRFEGFMKAYSRRKSSSE